MLMTRFHRLLQPFSRVENQGQEQLHCAEKYIHIIYTKYLKNHDSHSINPDSPRRGDKVVIVIICQISQLVI